MLDFIPVPDLKDNRDKFLSKVTRVAGKGNWFWVFTANKKLYSWEWGFQLYEDAFWVFLRNNLPLLKNLVEDYHEVFVLNRFDIDSGLDYKKQTQNRDHYDDIAIRRCLVRLGVSFKGKNILELAKSPYSQSVVPFHLPHLLQGKEETVRSWLDSHRLIAVAPEIEDKAKLSELLIR